MTSIAEAEGYYKYLKETKALLTQEAQEAATKEKVLKEDLLRVTAGLQKSRNKYTEKETIDLIAYENMQGELNERNLEIKRNEEILGKLERLIITVCNAGARLSDQLYPRDVKIDCKPKNIVKVLETCSEKLEELLELLKSNSLSHRDEVKPQTMEIPKMRRPRPSRTTDPALNH